MSENQLPRELVGSAPRPVDLTAEGRAAAVAAVALLVGAVGGGIFCYAMAVRGAARHELIMREGVTTEAEVVELGRTRGEHPRRIVTYRFSAGGDSYDGRDRLGERDRRDLEIGSTVPIRYLASDPAESWILGYEPRGVPVLVAPILSVSLGLAAWLILHAIRSQRRLLSGGRPALARVTGSKRVQVGKRRVHRVQFEFNLMSGALRAGYFDKDKKPPEEGSTVIVVYDPDEPRRHKLYPLSLVRVGKL